MAQGHGPKPNTEKNSAPEFDRVTLKPSIFTFVVQNSTCFFFSYIETCFFCLCGFYFILFFHIPKRQKRTLSRAQNPYINKAQTLELSGIITHTIERTSNKKHNLLEVEERSPCVIFSLSLAHIAPRSFILGY